MPTIALSAYVLLCGLVAGGLAGAALEAWARRPLDFSAPFVDPGNIARSLAVTALCGPFMLANEALAAGREGQASAPRIAGMAVLAVVWLSASGILVAAVASALAPLLY